MSYRTEIVTKNILKVIALPVLLVLRRIYRPRLGIGTASMREAEQSSGYLIPVLMIFVAIGSIAYEKWPF